MNDQKKGMWQIEGKDLQCLKVITIQIALKINLS